MTSPNPSGKFRPLILEREASPLTPKGVELFSKIIAAADRMKLLIDEILNYSRSRPDPGSMAAVDLNELLALVKSDMHRLIEEKRAIILCDRLPVVYGNALQLSQLFQNLMSNSIKFCPADRVPRIVLNASVVEGYKIRHPMASEQKKYLRIEITDNGIGFDPQYSEKIFQMFQRLHGRHEYPGTGMGLAICKKIVEHHQGFILAHSTPGQGAMFCCYFPEDMMVHEVERPKTEAKEFS